jgi:ribosomal protein L37AE/L43A
MHLQRTVPNPFTRRQVELVGRCSLGLHRFPAKSTVVRLELARSHLCPECGTPLEEFVRDPARNHWPCRHCEFDAGPLIAAVVDRVALIADRDVS